MTTLTLGDFDFYLYYLDSLKSDWQNFYDDAHDRSKYCNLLKEKKNEIKRKTISTIIKHLNKQEFERFMKIHYKQCFTINDMRTSKRILLSNMFYFIFKFITKEKLFIFKFITKEKLKNSKYQIEQFKKILYIVL